MIDRKGFLGMKKSSLIYNNLGFTLAEVLITLGIIGVIVALTLPHLILNYRNQVVETKLKKIYSIMNQAIALSEDINGNLEDWNFENPEFLNTYIVPYINKTDIKDFGSNSEYSSIYLADGSLLITKNVNYGLNIGGNFEYFFYPDAKNFIPKEFSSRKYGGSKFFVFRLIYPKSKCNPFNKKGFEPYFCGLNNTSDPYKDGLYACDKENIYKFSCTYVIQRNGWKIPKDYPIAVK